MHKIKKKLNTLSLSALIIGPILGSGVILLPALLYNMIGNYSLIIWLFTLFLGFIFALIFGKLAILYPGDGGVSLATKQILGKKYQLLSSFYLIFGVFFGPVAVLLIAAAFIKPYFPDVSLVVLGFLIYLITYILLLFRIDFIGKIMLIVSSTITIIFLISSINILINTNSFLLTLPDIDFSQIAYSFLLAFWAIVGWEVIGNYSNEVENTKTLTKAVVFSAITVSMVYTLICLAIVFGEFNKDANSSFQLIWLIEPIFKSYSNLVLASISMILCIGTLILFVGAVSRLISSLNLSNYTSSHLSNNTAIGALNLLSFIYISTLVLVYFEILSLDNLVAFSNSFFIANAIMGLLTAIAIFEKGFLKYSAIILSLLFFIILLFSNIFISSFIILLFFFTYFKKESI